MKRSTNLLKKQLLMKELQLSTIIHYLKVSSKINISGKKREVENPKRLQISIMEIYSMISFFQNK